jgi:hypothetical protein
VELAKMTSDKWKIVTGIIIIYAILGLVFTVFWVVGYITPGTGNQIVDFFFYFFLPIWASFAPFFSATIIFCPKMGIYFHFSTNLILSLEKVCFIIES